MHEMTVILEDFRELNIFGAGKPFKKKLFTQDKGQKNEVKSFIESVLNSVPPLIPAEEMFSTTKVTFKIVESLATGQVINLLN